MTALYITTQGHNTAFGRKPTFQPGKTSPVDILLPIPPAM
jgi:hypothetical protein